MNIVETYLREVMDTRRLGSGTPETSYYPALKSLFDALGKELHPKVRAVMNLKNLGGGLPDGGLFTLDQFPKGGTGTASDFQTNIVPARGVIEVKSPSANVEVIARTPQVQGYLARYGQVLVTNLWDFLLVSRDATGNMAYLERFQLAETEDYFLAKAASPTALDQVMGKRLVAYLKRVMLHAAPLGEPKDVAAFLAAYAQEALGRVEGSDLPALAQVKEALEEALGLQFHGTEGEHFFRSSLVQTIFYGIFSAWVVWAKNHPPTARDVHFNWMAASWTLHVPMIRALFHQITSPERLRALGLVEVLDWTARALDRVDRAEFFSRFQDNRAVQYFYEPFLQAFDPTLRKDLGVWYTPPEIVKYMVERVDQVLRTELGLADGLADPGVYILDPCCGTGAYLVEVLERIAKTLEEKGGDALLAQDLKRAAMTRLFGFEILPAPYVIAHLQLGLELARRKAPLQMEAGERVAVFLTNALTGWEPAKGPKQHFLIPELETERDQAEAIKQKKPILVILGNPPYNAFAGVSPAEEEGLVKPYKQGLNTEWKIKKFNLDELYVRFYRLAERRIAEMTGRGVVCFISSFSYLGDPSFVVMRKRLLQGFDQLWFDCMNGDSRQTGKLTPEGKPDPSAFSTDMNREGIQVGTAIGLMVKQGREVQSQQIRFRHFWGASKRDDLLASLGEQDFDVTYSIATPNAQNRFSFRPMEEADEYLSWPLISELFLNEPVSGLQEMRRFSLIDISQDKLSARVVEYFDKNLSWQELKAKGYGFTTDAGRFNAEECRNSIIEREEYDENKILHYSFLPFDVRFAYVTTRRPLWNEPRPTLTGAISSSNSFLITRKKMRRDPEDGCAFISKHVADYHFFDPNASLFPLYNKNENKKQHSLFGNENDACISPNISIKSANYLKSTHQGTQPIETNEALILHSLCVSYTPKYLHGYKQYLSSDFPRIPLPITSERLKTSASLGQRIADLLDVDKPVPGVNAGKINTALRIITVLSMPEGMSLDPVSGHLDLTAGWGHAGKGGAVMPGRGKIIEREFTQDELESLQHGAVALDMPLDIALEHLGKRTLDVYLNEYAHWRCVPLKVWEYYIGGYQVIKKWLSYREKPLLGRGLTIEEARHVSDTARRLAALRLLEPALDANYAAVVKNVYPWPHG